MKQTNSNNPRRRSSGAGAINVGGISNNNDAHTIGSTVSQGPRGFSIGSPGVAKPDEGDFLLDDEVVLYSRVLLDVKMYFNGREIGVKVVGTNERVYYTRRSFF